MVHHAAILKAICPDLVCAHAGSDLGVSISVLIMRNMREDQVIQAFSHHFSRLALRLRSLPALRCHDNPGGEMPEARAIGVAIAVLAP